MKTIWLDLLFQEPPLDAAEGVNMFIYLKYGQRQETPDGTLMRVGHNCAGATEIETNVNRIKGELDEIVREAKRRESAFREKRKKLRSQRN